MKFKYKIIAILCLLTLMFSACNQEGNALSVSFSNATGAGSTDMVLAVLYEEEKDYKEKYTDLYVKSDTENLTIKIKKELSDFVSIKLENKDTYYSLTKLISNAKIENIAYTKYKDALSVNYIINCEQDCNLTFKAVVGTKAENGLSLLDVIDASKEFTLAVKKHKN